MVTNNYSSPPLFQHPSTPSSTSPPTKKMSVSQTYFLAHRARAKLSSEAGRPDHNLRLLVGHANLLDSLMMDLADAEREQESWFNNSVRTAAAPKTQQQDRHVQWADTIPERLDEDWSEADETSESESDSDMDDEEEDEDIEMADAVPLTRIPSKAVLPPSSPQMQHIMEEDEEFEDDGEEDYASLALERSPSQTAFPPELELDEDSSEDESMPPSPPYAALPTFSDKQREGISATTTTLFDPKDDDQPTEGNESFYSEGFYLPPRSPTRLVPAISVY